MNRLLQGDVGSGKTVVAIAGMLLAVEGGFQSALMAPTQILAEQHYAVLLRWLEPLGVRIALRTGARQEDPLPLFTRATEALGSARVPRAGDGVSPSRTSLGPAASERATYFRRRLPHFEKPWAIYAVTIGTQARRSLSPAARTVVLNSLRHFHGQRYELFAACVMPDHVHLLIQPWPKRSDNDNKVLFWSLSDLLRSVKSFSAQEINRLDSKTGGVWERERFDRYIRSDRDLKEKFLYIIRNPWEAGWRVPRKITPALDGGGEPRAKFVALEQRDQHARRVRYPGGSRAHHRRHACTALRSGRARGSRSGGDR